MKLTKLSTKLTDMRGESLKLGEKKEEITVREVLANIVAAGFERPTPIEVSQIYGLSNLIYQTKEDLEISASQASLINKAVESNRWQNAYTPYVIGQMLLLSGLEQADKSQKK